MRDAMIDLVNEMYRVCQLVDPYLEMSPKMLTRVEGDKIQCAWSATDVLFERTLVGEYSEDMDEAMRTLITVVEKYMATPTTMDERMLVLQRRWYYESKRYGRMKDAVWHCKKY